MAISAVKAIDYESIVDKLDLSSKVSGNSDKSLTSSNETTFDSIFDSVVNMINETDQLTNQAEEEEIKYAMGEDNTLELLVAQNKANISLSYTVAVRDKLLDAYKEIMNMQF